MDFFPMRKTSNWPSSRLSKSAAERNPDIWSAFDDFFSSRFGDLPTTSELNNFSPDVNVKETDDAYTVEAELAGLNRDDIDIEIRADLLVLKGEKKSFKEDEKDNYYHMERRFGSFYRSIPLDTEVDESKCEANFADGLLTINLPKKAEKKPKSKKITIQ